MNEKSITLRRNTRIHWVASYYPKTYRGYSLLWYCVFFVLPSQLVNAVTIERREETAGLHQVQMGGQIRICGEYYRNVEASGNTLRWPSFWLIGRPIGMGTDILSNFGWDEQCPGNARITQWTRLYLKSDFQGGVSILIELDGLHAWGEHARSNYLLGWDKWASEGNTWDLYQGFLEAKEMFHLPLSIRIGRQEIRLGSEWLVDGNDDGPTPAWGLSFDALRLTYTTPTLTSDIWFAKLEENVTTTFDGDTDFYGAYTRFTDIKDMTLDAYWLWIHDTSNSTESYSSGINEWIAQAAGLDQYDAVDLHTMGFRITGTRGSLDFDMEIAYQFGNAGHINSLFKPVLLGKNAAQFDVWGLNVDLGYTFPTTLNPRIYVGYAYFEGKDNRDISFLQWLDALFNPFYTGKGSISFNRLFSNRSYSAILDGSDMSNAHLFHWGIELSPTETVGLGLDFGYYLADKVFKRPALPLVSWWTKSNSPKLGFETDLHFTYEYSDDLSFTIGWAHLFVGKGLRQGSFTASNGLEFNGGSSGDDADHVYFDTQISF